jgi:hypothetical protein
MTDPTRLRDLLEQAAPDSPQLSAHERAAEVARRGQTSRRRDRALVAAVAVAVVVAAVAVPTLRSSDGEPEPAESPNGPVAVCPTAPWDSTTTASAGLDADLVPAAVRVCPASEGSMAEQPSEPLTGQFAAAFMDDLRAAGPTVPMGCVAVGTAPWILQVQEDSGDIQRIYVSDPCQQTVQVGDRRVRISDVRTVFDGNLKRERTGIPDLACPRGASLSEEADTWHGSFDPTAAAAGIVCQQSLEKGRWTATVEGRLSPTQLATVSNSLALPPREHHGFGLDCGGAVQQRLVVLADADGDQTAWRGGCSGDPVLVSIRGEWELDFPTQSALHNALIEGGLS